MSDELTRDHLGKMIIATVVRYTERPHIQSGCAVELYTRLEVTGLDSLDWTEFMMELDDVFQVSLRWEDFDPEGKTVEDIVEAVWQQHGR